MRWGSLQCFPTPLAGFKGAYFLGRGEGKGGVGGDGKEGEGREGKGFAGPVWNCFLHA